MSTEIKIPHQDQRYIEALLNNDAVLINEIYQKNVPSIQALIRNNNGNNDDAGDVFQEILISLLQQAQNGFILTCPLSAFLYIACRNRWLNKLKKVSNRGSQLWTMRDLRI